MGYSRATSAFIGRWTLQVGDCPAPRREPACRVPLDRHRSAHTGRQDTTSLEDASQAGRLLHRMKTLGFPSLLIVDEIGYLPISRTGAMLLFQLMSRRYEHASTVLTSNKGFEEWGGSPGMMSWPPPSSIVSYTTVTSSTSGATAIACGTTRNFTARSGPHGRRLLVIPSALPAFAQRRPQRPDGSHPYPYVQFCPVKVRNSIPVLTRAPIVDRKHYRLKPDHARNRARGRVVSETRRVSNGRDQCTIPSLHRWSEIAFLSRDWPNARVLLQRSKVRCASRAQRGIRATLLPLTAATQN